MTTKVLDLNNIERKLFWALSGLLVGLVACYLYAVLSLTIAGVERDHMSSASRDLATQTGDLEGEYMNIQNSVTLARAQELGFHEVSAKFAGLSTADASNAAVKLSMAR